MQNPQWGLPSAWSENTGKTGKPDRTLRMSLVNITPDTDGTTLTHVFRASRMIPCPHSAELLNMANSGNNRQLSGNQCAESIDYAPASVLAPSDVDIPLQLKGILWIN